MTSKFAWGGDKMKVKAVADEGYYPKSISVGDQVLATNDDKEQTELEAEIDLPNVWPKLEVIPKKNIEVVPVFEENKSSIINIILKEDCDQYILDKYPGTGGWYELFGIDYNNEAYHIIQKDVYSKLLSCIDSITINAPKDTVSFDFGTYNDKVKYNSETFGTSSTTPMVDMFFKIPAHMADPNYLGFKVYRKEVKGYINNANSKYKQYLYSITNSSDATGCYLTVKRDDNALFFISNELDTAASSTLDIYKSLSVTGVGRDYKSDISHWGDEDGSSYYGVHQYLYVRDTSTFLSFFDAVEDRTAYIKVSPYFGDNLLS